MIARKYRIVKRVRGIQEDASAAHNYGGSGLGMAIGEQLCIRNKIL